MDIEDRLFSIKKSNSEPMTLHELERHIDQRIECHLERFAEKIQLQSDTQHNRLCELIESAFPGGDAAAHRQAHEDMIRWVRARRRFFEEITFHLAKGGVWALIGLMLIALWNWIKGNLNG